MGKSLDRLEKQFDIDVIFMDVHMPEMDGLSSTREIENAGRDQIRNAQNLGSSP